MSTSTLTPPLPPVAAGPKAARRAGAGLLDPTMLLTSLPSAMAKLGARNRVDALGIGLQRKDADRLYRALRSTLESAITNGGAHTGDVIAARRPGGTCPRCGAEMVHGTVGGRSTWWCSREQAAWP